MSVKVEIYLPRLEVVYKPGSVGGKEDTAACVHDVKDRVKRLAGELREKGLRCRGFVEDVTVDWQNGTCVVEFFASPVTTTVKPPKMLLWRQIDDWVAEEVEYVYYDKVVPALEKVGLEPAYGWRSGEGDRKWELWDYNSDLYSDLYIDGRGDS